MRKILLPLLASTISFSAYADDDNQYYAGFDFGHTAALDSNITGDDLTLRADKHNGWAGGLFFGKKIGKTRFEVEYLIRKNRIDFYDVLQSPTAGLAGTEINGAGVQKTSSFMVNGWRTFATAGKWSFDAGFGVGVAKTDLNRARQGANIFVDDSAWAPAVQVMAQVARPLSEAVDFSMGYRLFRAFKADYNTSGNDFTHRARNNELFARVSWKFGGTSAPKVAPAPAPIAAPAPAPEPVVTKPVHRVPEKPLSGPKVEDLPLPPPFIVYFDFDKSSITARASQTITEAAKAFRSFKAVSIRTNGHADRAGNLKYNEKLAERRANMVRDALIREGIPASKIIVRSVGETEPRVPTADGVREQENRAVEIVLVR